MWKVLVLALYFSLALLGCARAGPLRAEEKWKPLDNPRNRDLFFRTLQAYFSGRGVDVDKFPNSFSLDNGRPMLKKGAAEQHRLNTFYLSARTEHIYEKILFYCHTTDNNLLGHG
ncbi:hypothetical protein NDU88_004003 [Pleurodeles waltl]|uniref:Uncharacterized protein n=1 Tax=Pleurodeles waltl TaxID=8319 RepID=A0AAV7UGV0_PLEWA|nr:hypothetical protein NDU88_004003 [Pleurodeles waltl]